MICIVRSGTNAHRLVFQSETIRRLRVNAAGIFLISKETNEYLDSERTLRKW